MGVGGWVGFAHTNCNKVKREKGTFRKNCSYKFRWQYWQFQSFSQIDGNICIFLGNEKNGEINVYC